MMTYQPVNNHDDLLKVVGNMLSGVGLRREETGNKGCRQVMVGQGWHG